MSCARKLERGARMPAPRYPFSGRRHWIVGQRRVGLASVDQASREATSSSSPNGWPPRHRSEASQGLAPLPSKNEAMTIKPSACHCRPTLTP
jgi:hypothetical protein